MGRDSAIVPDDPALQFIQRMWAVDHELQRVSKRMESAIGLTGPQRFALLVIGRLPGVAAGELAKQLHLHPGTLTGIISRLEDAGLVERQWDATDARRMRLTLTPAGRAANRRREGTVESAVRDALSGTPPEEQKAAGEFLTRLAESLQAVASTRKAQRPTEPSSRRSGKSRSTTTGVGARRRA